MPLPVSPTQKPVIAKAVQQLENSKNADKLNAGRRHV